MRQVSFRRGVAVVLSAALLSGTPLMAEDTAPTGEQIIERYVEATGGRAAYEKLHNRHLVSTLEIAGLGLAIDIDIYQAKPNLFYSKASSPATGDMERGTDGKVFWETSTMTGPRILEGTELADAIREANFDKFVYWKDLYKSAEYIGSDSADGVYCQKVLLTPNEGNPMTLFFDPSTGLMTQVEMTMDHQMGQIPLVAKSKDYREVDGIKLPFTSEILVMGQTRTMTQKMLEHNIEIPDSLFELPADIKAMLPAEPAATE